MESSRPSGIVNTRCVVLDILVVAQVERKAHLINVVVTKQRADISVEAGGSSRARV